MTVFAFDGPTPMSTMRDAVLIGRAVVPGRHLHVGAVRAFGVGEPGAELLDVHRVVREEHVALERLGRGAAVMREPFHRQRHPFGREQEELLGPHLPGDLVERPEQRGIVERRGGTGGPDRHRRAELRAMRRARVRGSGGWCAGRANSPVICGLCRDQGRTTSMTGYQPSASMASRASHSSVTAAASCAGSGLAPVDGAFDHLTSLAYGAMAEIDLTDRTDGDRRTREPRA